MKPIRAFVYRKKHRSGNVTWVVRWKHPVTGQWFNLSGGKTKSDAEAIKSKLWQDLLLGKDPREQAPAHRSLEVRELIDLFYEDARYKNASAKWQAVIKGQFENVIRPKLGKLALATLKRDQLVRVYLGLKEQRLSHSTIKKYHQNLSLLGQLYEELNPGEESPTRKIRDFGKLFPKQAPTRDINFLTPDELERLYPQLESDSVRWRKNSSFLIPAFVKFLAATGLRREEAHDLEHDDIDRATGFICVRDSKSGETRMVPLERAAWDAIRDLPKGQKHVFVAKDGKRRHIDSFLVPVQEAARRAGITKRIDLHTLRHSYGSNKLRAGWGLGKVSKLLGHADIKVTAEVYAHLLDGDLKVRDEYRSGAVDGFAFDKKSEAANSESVTRAETVVTMIVKQLAMTLSSLPADALARPELAMAIRSAVSDALAETNSSEMQPAASSPQVLTALAETGLNVPHMFRDDSEEKSILSRPEKQKAGTRKDSSRFDSLSNGGPARVRTWDLQIRSLTL